MLMYYAEVFVRGVFEQTSGDPKAETQTCLRSLNDGRFFGADKEQLVHPSLRLRDLIYKKQ
jgi:hypothetical protein